MKTLDGTIHSSKHRIVKKVTLTFKKYYHKLMHKADKTMENLRRRLDIKLVRKDGSENEKIRKIIDKPDFNRRVEFSDELSVIHVNKTKLILN